MKIEVIKEFSFDAAHYLPGYDGKCQHIHGHTWLLQVGFAGEVNPKTGMVMDFADIKAIINTLIIDKLDHKYLNEVDAPQPYEQQTLFESENLKFPYHNPTAENMVGWILGTLTVYSHRYQGLELTLVRLYESPTSYAQWRASENVTS